MKKITLISIVLVALISLSACSFTVINGSGHVITEERTVSGIHGVDLSAYGELNITQGNTESFSIQGDDNIVPHIISEVRNGILFIQFDDKWGSWYRSSETIQFNLTVKNIDTITFSGAGSIKSTGLNANTLAISLTGAGDVEISNLQVNTVDVHLSGAGNVHLTGKAVTQKLSLSGVGNYNTEDMKSQIASISLTGAGNATIWVTDSLDVHVSGAGSVSYYGQPQVTKEITGLGSINQKGEK